MQAPQTASTTDFTSALHHTKARGLSAHSFLTTARQGQTGSPPNFLWKVTCTFIIMASVYLFHSGLLPGPAGPIQRGRSRPTIGLDQAISREEENLNAYMQRMNIHRTRRFAHGGKCFRGAHHFGMFSAPGEARGRGAGGRPLLHIIYRPPWRTGVHWRRVLCGPNLLLKGAGRNGEEVPPRNAPIHEGRLGPRSCRPGLGSLRPTSLEGEGGLCLSARQSMDDRQMSSLKRNTFGSHRLCSSFDESVLHPRRIPTLIFFFF